MPYFYLKFHIPPTNPSDDVNMYTVEGIISEFISIQMLIFLQTAKGVKKCVLKYIQKINETSFLCLCVSVGNKTGGYTQQKIDET